MERSGFSARAFVLTPPFEEGQYAAVANARLVAVRAYANAPFNCSPKRQQPLTTLITLMTLITPTTLTIPSYHKL